MSFERALRAARSRSRSGADWVAITGEVEVEPTQVSVARGVEWSLWDTRDRGDLPSEVCLGVGAAAVVESSGPSRFGLARAQLSELMMRIDGAVEARVRAFGGCAFEPGSLGPFRAFGDLRFVVPRWTFSRAGSRTMATLVTEPRQLALPDPLLRELDGLLACRPQWSATATRVSDDGRARFLRTAREAVASVEAHRVDKVVVVRRVVVEGAIEPRQLLDALAGESSVTRFGFSTSEHCFVGATPELLVAWDGRLVRSEAVAGTLARGRDLRELRESAKDRREHAYVVRAIHAALEGAGAIVSAVGEPEIRSLRHVHHWVTPIDGRLGADVHVLDLLRALHPTPAVLGVPADAARSFLRQFEGIERGWFAAPVGFVDAGGRGIFMVALRSALLSPRRAWVFAGAGVVRGSVAEVELAETEAKLTTMLSALAASRPSPDQALGAL